MQTFSRVAPQQVLDWLNQQQPIQLLDTRDEQSFLAGHIENAVSLAQNGIAAVTDQLETDQPVVIYCYHGISSQQVAAYLCQLGFDDVYSMDGGFEHWRTMGPYIRGHE